MDAKRSSSSVSDTGKDAKQIKQPKTVGTSTSDLQEERNCVVNISVPEDHLSIQDLLCLKPYGYHSDMTNSFVVTSLQLGRFVNTITLDGNSMKMDLKPPKWPMSVNLDEAKALWPALKCMTESIESSQDRQLNLVPQQIVEDTKRRKSTAKCCDCGCTCVGVDMIG